MNFLCYFFTFFFGFSRENFHFIPITWKEMSTIFKHNIIVVWSFALLPWCISKQHKMNKFKDEWNFSGKKFNFSHQKVFCWTWKEFEIWILIMKKLSFSKIAKWKFTWFWNFRITFPWMARFHFWQSFPFFEIIWFFNFFKSLCRNDLRRENFTNVYK